MSSERSAPLRLAVLNPGGRDPEQSFADNAKLPRGAHAPVNYHAYAACTGGMFFRDAKAAAECGSPVLLLLRGDFRAGERALRVLQSAGRQAVVLLKETGLHQIAEQLSDSTRLARFLDIVERADGCLAPTPEAADIYAHIRADRGAVAFIPTPYPLHDQRWDFSRPVSDRDGIFVGTREWKVPSRNHAAALLAARRISDATGARVTVYNVDGRAGERLLGAIGFRPGQLRVLTRGAAYADYLRVVAEHKLVLEMDTSFVPGQVAGDALLCRLPCVGGNGAVDRLAHPTTSGSGRSGAELVEIAMRLLTDPDFYARTVGESQRSAAERLSFGGVAEELRRFVSALPGRAPRA